MITATYNVYLILIDVGLAHIESRYLAGSVLVMFGIPISSDLHRV